MTLANSSSSKATPSKATSSKATSRKRRKRKPRLKTPALPRVQLSPSLWRTLILLLFMCVIGGISGAVGYSFGRESLKGITQPALNPVLGDGDGNNRRPRQGVSLLNEKDIIKKLKSQNQSKPSKASAKAKSKASPTPKPEPTKAAEEDKKKPVTSTKLPAQAAAEGTQLTIQSLQRDDTDLVLSVALKNEGSDPVKFVYNFLDVTDEKGKPLPVEVQGLPETLTGSSDTFYGSVRLLGVVNDKPKKLSLKLASYPDQEIKLEVLNIPVSE